MAHNTEQPIDHASEYLDQLADEIQRYNDLRDSGFSLSIAGPLRDVLDARYALKAALDKLPDAQLIAYEASEADARLMQRVLRLATDVPLTKLEAATMNIKIREDGRLDEVQNAFRQSRHGRDDASRDVGRSRLAGITRRHWRLAREWIKLAVDRFVEPRPKF